jgi:protein involved in polysaccharide export with SLBB domain
MNKTFRILFLTALILIVEQQFSIAQQSIIPMQDYSSIHVDELTDVQVRKFVEQASATGLGAEKMEQVANANGMSNTEVEKLKKRIEKLNFQDSVTPVRSSSSRQLSERNESFLYRAPISDEQEKLRSKIFGASLFANVNPTFEPNLRLATPQDYEIGPDDEILIDIFGYSEASYQLKVSPEGTINIPLIGVVQLSNMTIEQASSRIRSKLSIIYAGIKNKTTSVNVSLGNIRSIKVILTGEVVKPGTYSLPSVATVFNALYACGGPTENGSYRTIQILRDGNVVDTLDVYDFLLQGSMKKNIRLHDQDVIRVPTYQTRVTINGEVKHPAIFEMLKGETMSDLLRYSGGFNEKAYKARIKILKVTETEKKIEDVLSGQFDKYEPTTGDEVFVNEVLNRYKNRVTISGALFRPGEYELDNGLTLKGLIQKTEGLKEDAFLNRGYIIRLKEDLSTEMLTFNTSEILSGKSSDIKLKREDKITIPSIFDLKEEYKLSINGEVRNPGVFDFAENTTLEDIIIRAGGFREGATPKRIEVARRVRSANLLSDTTQIAQLFLFDIDRDFISKTGDFILEPFDIISVRPAPGYQVQKIVRIEGEVLYPGFYTISGKNERVSDLIKRAGGLTAFAYKNGASLKRTASNQSSYEMEIENLKQKQLQSFQQTKKDSIKLDFTDESIRNDYVGINLSRIIHNPKARFDLLLEDGDVIHIPKLLQTVKVSGEILSPTSLVYSNNKILKDYVQESGGFSSKAQRRRAYIVYANGSAAGTKRILFFNNYPRVKPGSEIFIPKKEIKERKITPTEIVAISTGLATIATLLFTILK